VEISDDYNTFEEFMWIVVEKRNNPDVELPVEPEEPEEIPEVVFEERLPIEINLSIDTKNTSDMITYQSPPVTWGKIREVLVIPLFEDDFGFDFPAPQSRNGRRL